MKSKGHWVSGRGLRLQVLGQEGLARQALPTSWAGAGGQALGQKWPPVPGEMETPTAGHCWGRRPSPRPRESPVSGEVRGRAAAPGTPQVCGFHPTSSCVLVLAGVKSVAGLASLGQSPGDSLDMSGFIPRASATHPAGCGDGGGRELLPRAGWAGKGTALASGPWQHIPPWGRSLWRPLPWPRQEPRGRAKVRPRNSQGTKQTLEGVCPSPHSSQTARHESWQYNVYFILKNKPKPPDPFPRGLLTELPGRAWLQPSRGR